MPLLAYMQGSRMMRGGERRQMDRPVHISNICHVVEKDGKKKAVRVQFYDVGDGIKVTFPPFKAPENFNILLSTPLVRCCAYHRTKNFHNVHRIFDQRV